MSRVLALLTVPRVVVGGPEKLKELMRTEVLYIFFIAIGVYSGYFIQKRSFAKLSEVVTYKIRVILYDHILQKNIGWFDLKENGTSNLTSAMAEQTAVINMAAGESAGPILEATFALFGGIAISCFYCWQVALCCMGLIPFIVFANSLSTRITKKQMEDAQDSNKEAQVLCGDACANYKTVQSLAYEDRIVNLYVQFMSKQ